MNPARFKHRIAIQRKEQTDGPLGPTVEWVDKEIRWGRFTYTSIEGRAKYQQIGHSAVAGTILFRGPVEIDMANHRFVFQGQHYEAIEPPVNRDTVNRLVSIAVQQLPQQPDGEGEDEEEDNGDIPGPL